MDAVKFVDRSEGIIEGLAIPYGGPMDGRDLDGEAFDKDTKFYLDAYEKRPILYRHGTDELLRFSPVGTQTKATRREQGIWAEGVIDKASEYADLLLALVDKGMLGFSSGAAPRSVAKSADGLITEWFWQELSLTPDPANPFAIVSAKSKQPVIGIKAQAEILKKLGRLPDANEAQELAAPYMQQAEGSADKVESRLAALEQDRDARDAALKAKVRLLTVEHERIIHGGIE